MKSMAQGYNAQSAVSGAGASESKRSAALATLLAGFLAAILGGLYTDLWSELPHPLAAC